ncbi:unnamed protein product [Protopolystoma xenopodis]|uniref:Nipped-B protein n=1 Tax=Protopolystoma xenopodis TaxID=117903 RepID=A0A3S5BCI7_9PLAT|nr:unnamed protein product [Protopolystoma xenopodis]
MSISLSQLVFVADNLAFFPYQCQEEPLFVVHHIDLMVSMAGSNVLQNVREALFPELKAALEAALVAQGLAEAKARAQAEADCRAELATRQARHDEAVMRGDVTVAEVEAAGVQAAADRLESIKMLNAAASVSNTGAGGTVTTGSSSGMSTLRSTALVCKECKLKLYEILTRKAYGNLRCDEQ